MFGTKVLEAEESGAGGVGVGLVEVFGGDAAGGHFIAREVDAAIEALVLDDVAEDVGELEGVAEVFGESGSLRILTAEDADGDEADGGGDAVTVAAEVVEGGEGLGGDVVRDTVNNFVEILDGDVEARNNRGEGLGERLGGGAASGEGVEVVTPAIEGGGFLGGGNGGVIGDIVDRTAEIVEGGHGGALLRLEAEEGEGQIGARAGRGW